MIFSESVLSNETIEKIHLELQLMNANMADANDIAMLTTYKTIPPELDELSRKALRRLRDKVMERAPDRTEI